MPRAKKARSLISETNAVSKFQRSRSWFFRHRDQLVTIPAPIGGDRRIIWYDELSIVRLLAVTQRSPRLAHSA